MQLLKNLKNIASQNKGKLIGTFSIVLAENILFITYPIFGAFAINGVIKGNLYEALSYSALVLIIWFIGSVRRAVDTRTFSKIYAEMVVKIILEQREKGEKTSAITARVALSRELVDFFEHHLPILLTSIISIIGAVFMLMIIEFWAGIVSLIILIVFFSMMRKYSKANDKLYFKLNNKLEEDVNIIKDSDKKGITEHYNLLALLRIKISNREALSYAIIGIAMAILFGITLSIITLRGDATAGHLYAVISYLWTFATSIDDGPRLVEEFSKIKDISNRVQIQDEENIKN